MARAACPGGMLPVPIGQGSAGHIPQVLLTRKSPCLKLTIQACGSQFRGCSIWKDAPAAGISS